MDAHSPETELVRRLFKERVPEVASGAVEIRGIAREVGVLSMLVVYSAEGAGFDTVGACVGPRGIHLKEIGKNLGGELMAVSRWSDSIETLIENLVAPNCVEKVSFNDATREATVTLRPDSVLPPGVKEPERFRATRLRLASRLVGWNIRIDSANGG